MKELVFELTQEEDGGYCAKCLTENIFTQGDTWNAVHQNIQEAVRAFFFDQPPMRCRIQFSQSKVLREAKGLLAHLREQTVSFPPVQRHRLT